MATAYLTRTPGSAGDRKTWTLSGWYKRSGTASDYLLSSGQYSSTQLSQILFEGDSKFNIAFYSSAAALEGHLETTRLFRDPAAWYHIVVACDTTQAGSSDRLKLYVNGVQETVFATETYPAQDYEPSINNNVAQNIGRREGSGFFNGVMAHVHFTDGTAYAASDFGETDSTSGIWVAKTSPSVTYGTNGYFLKFQDTAAFGDDSSGNTNDFTMSGTMTQTKDTPDNNWCTINPIDNYYGNSTFSNGNNTIVTPSSTYSYNTSTMYLSTGLWYWEEKINSSSGYDMVGIADKPSIATDGWLGYYTNTYCYRSENGQTYTAGSGTAYGDTFTTGDIIGVYLDLTANKLYFAKNGTIQNSGTGISITAAASTTTGYYTPGVGDYHNTGAGTYDLNFGNGYFGTTAVSSAVADAGGEGQFEYDPSAGTFDGSSKDFRAICTNNLATYG